MHSQKLNNYVKKKIIIFDNQVFESAEQNKESTYNEQLYEISFPLFGHIAEQDYLFLNNKLDKN